MIVDVIADLVHHWQRTPLSFELSHHTRRAMLDWAAATIVGAGMPPAMLLVRAFEDDLDRGSASLVPDGRPASPRTAALINATASHTAEVDDIFRDGLYHPGCPTIGAALAVAESTRGSGADFERAVAIGYEVGTRLAAAVNPQHYRYWHTTGTVGTIGAAVAAAVVLGAGRAQVADAIATATTFAAGLQQAFRSEAMSKPLHAGHAADAGVLAATAARAGITGAHDVLDGDAGFAAAMAEGADLSMAFADSELGNITEMTFKAHAACGHAFAAIDAAIHIRSDHRIDTSDIERIVVSTYATAIGVAGNPAPVTPFEAKFSIPYTVSVALNRGSVQLDAFGEEIMRDAEINRLVPLVSLAVDPDIDDLFPSRRAARVQVHTRDGAVVDHFSPTRRGDPDAPLSDEELNAKFRDLSTPVVGAERADRISLGIWSLGDRDGVRGLWA